LEDKVSDFNLQPNLHAGDKLLYRTVLKSTTIDGVAQAAHEILQNYLRCMAFFVRLEISDPKAAAEACSLRQST
jgi:hypothetical protein